MGIMNFISPQTFLSVFDFSVRCNERNLSPKMAQESIPKNLPTHTTLRALLLVLHCCALTILITVCNLTFAASSSLQTDQVRAELIAYAPQGIKAGQPFWLGLKLSHQPLWHTYWKNPGDSGLPTQLTWDLPKGLMAKDVLWPTPQKLYVSTLTNYGYEGEILLVTPVIVTENSLLLGSSIDIGLHANWLICKQECVPQEGEFRLKVPLKSSSALDASDFLSVLNQQPIELTKDHQTLELVGNRLVGKILGIPKSQSAASVVVFPELSEVISDPKQTKKALSPNPSATDSSANTDFDLDFKLHPMRSSEPSSLGALIVLQTPQGPTTYHTSFEIKGTWPKIQSVSQTPIESPTLASKNADVLGVFAIYPFIAAALGAFLGGMILNLMPCVLPILAIKVLSLATHSKDQTLYRRHSAGYAAGVVFCFLALGGLVVGLKAIGLVLGWGFQLQSPIAVAGLSFLFLSIALNLLGVFEIHFVVPNRLLMIKSQDPGIDGFLSGILSVVVAAPCTAPFMGASLGWAMTAANWQGLLIFICLGIGMAFPILLISFVPALGRLLPKPGAWMNTMRVFLAFPMLLTVTWLLWVFGQQLGLNQLILLIVALITFSAMTYCSKLLGPAKVFGALFFAALLIFELAIAGSLKPLELATYDGSAPSQTSSSNLDSKLGNNLIWETWSPELVQQTLAEGRPVFVDFTAAWCITCQVNERTTLQNETIKSLLHSKNVRLLKADWTQPNELIASTLAGLGRNGIPVYLLLSPQTTILSELLTLEDLTSALNALSDPANK